MKQIHDIVITIASVAKTDEDTPYVATRVFRGELIGDEKDIEKFIAKVSSIKSLDSLDQMKND